MIETYFKGLGLLLAIILLGVVAFIAIGIIILSVSIVLGIMFACIAIIALLAAPYYFGREHEVKSKNFRLKKIRKKEKL